MKFRYTRVPDNLNPKGYSIYPFLQVRLGFKSKALNLRGLIDSGAVDCLFHRTIGEALGMDIDSGTPKTYAGIAGQEVTGYVHSIKLQVQGFSEWVQIEAGFIDIDFVPLLGESGFFDNYQIVFERYRGRFEVNSRTRFRP